jgi:hypothetical protein
MNWDWNLISQVASVVGVGGGLISVGFLVHGVRRNARAIEGATVQSLMNFEKDVFAMIAADAPLFLKGCETPQKLSAADRLKFERIVATQLSLFYSAFVQHGEGLIDDEVWVAYANALRNYMKPPGFRGVWTKIETHYPKSFGAMIAGL